MATSSTQNPPRVNLPGGPSALLSGLFGAGMASLLLGERLIGVGKARIVFSAVGVALIVAMLAMRLVRAAAADGDRARVERTIAFLQGLGLVAILLYFLQSDAASAVLGKPLESGWPKLQVSLQALWPALWIAAVMPLFLVEISYASMARAPHLETGRVRDAMLSGFGLAGALVFCFSTAYVATARDKKVDLSYFRTARPGEATRKIVQQLDKSIEIAYFYPPANEVRDEVKSYLDDLGRESKFFEVESYDVAVDPAKAKELGVSGNGVIVVARGGRREQLSISTDLESARSQLRSLDKEMQKRLVLVARTAKTVYMTVGHGERTTDPSSDTDKRSGIRTTRQLLLEQGYTPRDLGAAEGLATDVPADAGTVIMIGPTKPLLPEEAASLVRYVGRGGHMFVALDPEAGLDMKELLGPLGLVYKPVMLVNDQAYATLTHQASDKSNIITRSYSSHPTVAVLGRMHVPVVLIGAGALEEAKDKPKDVQIDFTVHSHMATWNDLNGDFQFDEKTETRKTWELVAALTKKKPPPDKTLVVDPKAPPPATPEEGRVVLLGDSDAISDSIISNAGNPALLVDGMKWLLGDEAISGETVSEVDLPIQHTRNQDVMWFYSTIFVAPALVLGVGVLATRKRRRGRARPGGAKDSSNPASNKEAA